MNDMIQIEEENESGIEIYPIQHVITANLR